MEYTRAMEYKVGIFIVISTILTLVFIMALGGDKAFFSKQDHLQLVLDETMGLGIGSMVQVAGVPCGNVDKITFDANSTKLNISLKIERKYMARITKGSTVSILTQGALGDKYISIKPGPYDAEQLKDGEVLSPEIDVDFIATLGKSGNKVEKVFDILDNVEKIVAGLNQRKMSENLGDTMQHLKRSTQALDEILASLRSSDAKHNNVKKSLDHMASILEKIDSGQGTLGGLINDPTVHEDLKALLGGAKRSKLLKYLIRQTIQKSDSEEIGGPGSGK